jgi:5-methylcytosine-specific restriction enzyme A
MMMRVFPAKVRVFNTSKLKPAPKRVDPFYLTPEWRALMDAIIKHRGRRCQDPDHNPSRPRDQSRIFGDHIIELKDGGDMFDPSNILLRCGSCHTRKTAAERAKRR